MTQTSSDRSRPALTAVFSAGFLGGSELFNLEFLRRAIEDGIAVHAVVPARGTLLEALEETAQSVTVVETPAALNEVSRFDSARRVVPSLRRVRDTASYLRRLRHAVGTTPGPICCFGFRAQIAVSLLPRLRRRLGWVIHEIVPPGPYAWLWRALAHRPTSIWAPSTAAAQQDPLRGIPVEVCAVGLTLDPFIRLPPAAWPPLKLGMIGDLYPLKNHLGLIEVVRRLRARGVPAEGLLVGRASTNSQEHERYAERIVEVHPTQ